LPGRARRTLGEAARAPLAQALRGAGGGRAVTLFDVDLVDDAARRAIRDDLGRNLFVEAGAGTGKTTVLVDRVVNLFAQGVLAEPGELVAITFTEAAAAELRDRIRT